MKIIIGPSLRRVCEIALVNDFEINVFAGLDNKRDIENAKESIKLLENELNVKFSKNGILKCEYNTPTFKNDTFEPLSEIAKRAKEAKNRILNSSDLYDNSQIILNTATDKLKLNSTQIQDIINIALNIAKLDNANKIEAFHIAEAIQYSYIDNENIISIFDNVVSFGGIEINLCGLTKENIKDAIEYLSKF